MIFFPLGTHSNLLLSFSILKSLVLKPSAGGLSAVKSKCQVTNSSTAPFQLCDTGQVTQGDSVFSHLSGEVILVPTSRECYEDSTHGERTVQGRCLMPGLATPLLGVQPLTTITTTTTTSTPNCLL